jgi:Stress responsive A/B Barrel Domain
LCPRLLFAGLKIRRSRRRCCGTPFFFKFKDDTSAADVKKVVAAFDALPKKIDSIKDYQAGKNISPIGFDDGYTQCFLVTFKDEAGREKYLPHPDHKAFGATLRPYLDKVFVVDYWGKPEKARKERELKHALFVKFKDGTTSEQVKEAEEALAKLPSQCDKIKAFEWGKNNSPEKHDEGFTHCFMFTFDDVDGLKTCAAMPAHKEVVEKLHAIAEKGRVLDFWTKEKPGGENK